MEWLDARGAAELLGVTPNVIRQWCRTGKLPHIRRVSSDLWEEDPDDPETLRRRRHRGPRTRIFIALVDLQNFLFERWQNGRKGRRPVLLKALIETGQLREIDVQVRPMKESPAVRMRQGQIVRDYMMSCLPRVHEMACTRSAGGMAEDQLELFPDAYSAPRYITLKR